MQIVETANEGLKRAYTLTIPASDISSRVDKEVKRIAPQVRMPGFRPGKVPANLVKKMHGEALHGEVLNGAIREGVDELFREKNLRPAMQPDVNLSANYQEGRDAEVTVELQILPEIEVPAIEGLKLERLIVPVTDAQVDEAAANLAQNQKSFTDAPKTRKAQDGDQLIIDFVGKIDGEAFDGGSGENQPLEIGAGRFIPGFEEQLAGAKAGDEKTVTVTFPDDYPAENLKGQEATFDVKVHAVKIAGEAKVDEDFAKALGLESLDKLKELLRGQLEQELGGLTRTQMKRQLLDKLAADHDFAVPPAMVDAEFDQIWAQLQQEAAKEEDPAAAINEIEAEKDDYRQIAERRVRLGLLLSEIGQANNVEVSEQEMQMLVAQAAQRYRPEDRQRFMQYVQSDPMAAAQIRAPLYEDKVIDFLFDKADVTEREVTREALEAAIEADSDEAGAGAAAKKPAAKKPAAKKPASKKAATQTTDKAKAAPKKAPAKKPAAEPAQAKQEAKPAAKKAPAKKPAAAKGDADKPAAKKPAAKKAPATKPAAKSADKKPAARKKPAQKPAS